jgi:hypothetical protein
VLLLFWSRLREQGQDVCALAYVQYYTTHGCGQADATRLTKVTWEEERRLVGGRYSMVPKTAVIAVSSMIKLEHIVPLWAETQAGQRPVFYVNKYASFC